MHILRASVKDTLYSYHRGGAKEVCQIIIHDAYDSLCTEKYILDLHGASGLEHGASEFCTLKIFSAEQTSSHKYNQTPHKSNMLVTYEYKEVLP